MIVIMIEIYVFVGKILGPGSERVLDNVIDRSRSIHSKGYILCLRLRQMLSVVILNQRLLE